MGMQHKPGADTQNDEIARIFQIRVRQGEFVEVGKDKSGNPLYMEVQTASGRKPFAWLDAVTSNILNAFLRKVRL